MLRFVLIVGRTEPCGAIRVGSGAAPVRDARYDGQCNTYQHRRHRDRTKYIVGKPQRSQALSDTKIDGDRGGSQEESNRGKCLGSPTRISANPRYATCWKAAPIVFL